MDPQQRKRYIRLIYAKALRCFAAGLVAAALIGGLYRSRIYFVFGLCAMGGFFLAWSWFTYLHMTGFRLIPGLKTERKKKTPYIHQREKKKRYRPSFAMENTDFDDDLVSATAANEEEFDKKHQALARIWARAAGGALLFLVSFIIKT